MTKILSSVKNVSTLLFMLVVIIAVVGFASGTVSMERIGYVVDVFRGELPVPKEEPEEPTEEERNEKAAQNMERTENELIERDVSSAEAGSSESRHEMIGLAVEVMQKDITAKIDQLEKEMEAFYAERKRIAEETHSEAFIHQVSILEKAEPGDAAEFLKEVDDKRTLLLLKKLKPQITVEILRELNKHPARNGQGTRGAELYAMMGEYKDTLGTINLE